MIQLSSALTAALNAPANQPVDLYELYLESGTRYYSTEDITWGGHHYLPYVTSRSSIKRFDGGEFDRVSVTLSNVDTALAQILTTEEIEGRKLVIRKIDRTVNDDSLVIFAGVLDRASKIDENSASISATQIIGSIDHECPSRTFSQFCPWKFKGDDCGYAGAATECSKSWARCSELGNTSRYGGFRFFPHSGTYQWEETVKKRILGLLLFSRKKTKTVTATYTNMDDTPYDVPIPIILGRAQIAGIPIQHADAGGELKVLAAMCVGTIHSYAYVRANGELVSGWTSHHGQDGGTASQLVDERFPTSYPYHRLAYVGLTLPSELQVVDSAPSIDAVVIGSIVDFYDAASVYAGFGWTDNPAWCVHHFMTMPLAQGGMGIPVEEFDHAVLIETAAYCDELILDTTNDQKIFEPTSLPDEITVGENYKRYRSTGVSGQDPSADGPYEEYGPGNDDTSTTPAPVQVRRFTMNVAIAKAEKAVDLLHKKLLPSFRGFLTVSKTGKIQIRCERPVANTTVAAASSAGATSIAMAASVFAAGEKVLVGALTANAEVLTVAVAAASLQFTAATQFDHDAGETVHKVEMAFNDANIVGEFEYPLSDRQPSTNRISLKYVDAPAGFEERELQVNDYEHQERTHKINSEDVDGSAIDNYFQAWRIGQWKRAKARDLGKFCSLRADIKASSLEIGDVIAVSAGEAGLQAVPFRVIELAFEENDEVALVGQLYSVDVYDDSAPQATVTVPSIYSPVLPIRDEPLGEVTNLQAAVTLEDGRVRIAFSGDSPVDANFAGCNVFIEIPQEGDDDPEHPTLPGQFYPQDWHVGEPSASADAPKIWEANLDVPFPPDAYLKSLAEPRVTWVLYALSRSWGDGNRLIRLRSITPEEPAAHTPALVITLDFTAYIGGLVDESLGSVTLVGPARLTATTEGIVVEQDYTPPYIHFADQVTIGTFEGVAVVAEDSEGNVSKAEQQPYTADPYVDLSNIMTARIVLATPSVLPATFYIHLMSYSPEGRQRFKKVINGGAPLIHAQYAIATVTVTSVDAEAPGAGSFSVTFDGWHVDGAGVPKGKLDATWTKLGGDKLYGLWFYEGAAPPVSPYLWIPTDVNVTDPPVTFWIDPVSEAKRIYFCLVYQSKDGALLPPDFGAALPIAYVDLVPPAGLDPTKLDPTAPPPPTGVSIELSETSFLDAYALSVDWTPGTPTGTLAGHNWSIQHFTDATLLLPDGDPIRGYQPSAEGSEASVYVGRRPSVPKYAVATVTGVSLAGKFSAPVSSLAVLIPAMPVPAAPLSNTSDVVNTVQAGIPKYGFILVAELPVDKTALDFFKVESRIYTTFADAAALTNLNVEDDWKWIGEIDPHLADEGTTRTSLTDLWPSPEEERYARIRICGKNIDNQLGPWSYSGVLTIAASSGLDLTHANPAAVGPGLILGPNGLASTSRDIMNTNFEDAVAGVFKDWGVTAGVSVNSVDQYSGSHCVEITPALGEYRAAVQSVPTVEGRSYLWQIHARSTLDGHGFASVSFYSDENEFIKNDLAQVIGDEWLPYKVFATAPAGATKAQVEILASNDNSSGRLLADQVSLIALEPTGSGVTRTDEGLTNTSKELKNPNFDFEGKDWGFTPAGVTFTTVDAYAGIAAKLTADPAGVERKLWQDVPAAPGQVLRLEGYLQENGNSTSLLEIRWLNAAGGEISGVSATINGDAYALISTFGAAPANTASARCQVKLPAANTSGRLMADQLRVIYLEPVVGAVGRTATGMVINYAGAEFTVVGGELTVNGVPMSKATGYNNGEFQVVGGEFQAKAFAAEKIVTGTFAAGVAYVGAVYVSQLRSGTANFTGTVTFRSGTSGPYVEISSSAIAFSDGTSNATIFNLSGFGYCLAINGVVLGDSTKLSNSVVDFHATTVILRSPSVWKTALGLTTTTLSYKDHAGINQTMTVCIPV